MYFVRAAAVALGLAGVAALAQAEHPMIMSGGDVTWQPAPPSMPKGAQIAVLAGDPAKEGPFTLRIKTPANFDIPAHSHPTDEAVTVLSGEFHLGMGEKLDKSKTHALTPGGFVVAPATMNHFGFTTVETIVQVSGMGPFAITYVNPADDPRTK
jgi:quercetin dioxygenase-like cupin family protein